MTVCICWGSQARKSYTCMFHRKARHTQECWWTGFVLVTGFVWGFCFFSRKVWATVSNHSQDYWATSLSANALVMHSPEVVSNLQMESETTDRSAWKRTKTDFPVGYGWVNVTPPPLSHQSGSRDLPRLRPGLRVAIFPGNYSGKQYGGSDRKPTSLHLRDCDLRAYLQPLLSSSLFPTDFLEQLQGSSFERKLTQNSNNQAFS